MSGGERLVGLIADTHGLVRPELFAALAGVEVILHAGDVGEGVLEDLSAIAPVRAVYGNTDRTDDPRLPVERLEEFDGVRVHVSHGHELGSPTPEALLAAYDADVLVYGHTHRPLLVRADGRWVVNPGAAGPRRFDIVPSIARMRLSGHDIRIDHVLLIP
ncbi:MAG: metallophosphoesterase family protein [Gemmatimonadaceae bacterium]|nr:metallophosphoesterase family protein [Gemmatimonadaceae bacterium]